METTSEPVNPDDIGLSEMEDLTSREQSSANEVTEEVESDEDKEHAENSSEKMDEADA